MASTTGWGAASVSSAIGAFIGNLRPKSAAAELIVRGARFDLSGVGSLSLPTISAEYPQLTGVAEGAPIPVNRPSFGSITLSPTKLAGIAAFTSELRDYSAGTAELAIQGAIEVAAGRGLDALVLSNAAATATTPAGLLAGTAALAATVGGGLNAVAGDIGKLVAAIHAAGGGRNIVIFAAPPQAATLKIYAPNLGYDVVVAPHLAAGTIIAVEVDAFASGFSETPRVDLARDAVVHMDTVPLHISAVGSPDNTVAAPTRSGYQSDTWFLKLVLRMAYGMRLPGGAQWIVGASY